MAASRKRLGRSLRLKGKEVDRRTWPWPVRPRKIEERVLARRGERERSTS